MVCNRLVGLFYFIIGSLPNILIRFIRLQWNIASSSCCRLCFLVAIGFKWLEANALAMTLSTECVHICGRGVCVCVCRSISVHVKITTVDWTIGYNTGTFRLHKSSPSSSSSYSIKICVTLYCTRLIHLDIVGRR